MSAPAGTIGSLPAPATQEKQYSAKVEGQLSTPEQFGNIILKSTSNGHFVESLLLVILVVFVFLQKWRTTLIPVLSVPVSIVGTFASFKVLDFTINTLTLFAMVLAIGLVVDDAIVVIENVEEHMSKDKLSAKDATEAAMKEVQGPIIATTAVLASIFIPVAFIGGVTGVLYKQFAVTITISVVISAFRRPDLDAGLMRCSPEAR